MGLPAHEMSMPSFSRRLLHHGGQGLHYTSGAVDVRKLPMRKDLSNVASRHGRHEMGANVLLLMPLPRLPLAAA